MQLQIIRNKVRCAGRITQPKCRKDLRFMDARPPRRNSLTERTVGAAQALLGGGPRSWRGYLAFGGPAVIASIAYMDPGNYATNIQAGAKYGYSLLWVVLGANLIAMLFQALSAKLGIVTGRNLAEMCRDAVSAAGGLGDVGRQRNRRHGHRPGRVPRRRHRPRAAVQHAAAGRHGGHRHRHLRHPDGRGPRLPPARNSSSPASSRSSRSAI